MSTDYLYISHKSFHGIDIASFTEAARSLIRQRQMQGQRPKLSKRERMDLQTRIEASELSWVQGGVNFSRIQIAAILEQAAQGEDIEFEAFAPYLGSYMAQGGKIYAKTLLNEDAIGLQLAVLFRDIFPGARLISLCDDYNAGILGTAAHEQSVDFDEHTKAVFYESIRSLLIEQGAVPKNAVAEVDYLLISEGSKVADAMRLVEELDRKGHINRDDQGIWFVNEAAEQPLHRQFQLQTKSGRWLCEALDAATFLKKENLHKTHIVALPNYMKMQQDKVWEILRVLGIRPDKYHNIFYRPDAQPEQIVEVVSRAFRYAQENVSSAILATR